MKKLIFSSLLGLALFAFTGCTDSSDVTAVKCQSGKCDGAKKCNAATKCSGDKAKKADTSSKCGK